MSFHSLRTEKIIILDLYHPERPVPFTEDVGESGILPYVRDVYLAYSNVFLKKC